MFFVSCFSQIYSFYTNQGQFISIVQSVIPRDSRRSIVFQGTDANNSVPQSTITLLPFITKVMCFAYCIRWLGLGHKNNGMGYMPYYDPSSTYFLLMTSHVCIGSQINGKSCVCSKLIHAIIKEIVKGLHYCPLLLFFIAHRITALCEGNPPITDGFPLQRVGIRKALQCHDVIMSLKFTRYVILIDFIVTYFFF